MRAHLLWTVPASVDTRLTVAARFVGEEGGERRYFPRCVNGSVGAGEKTVDRPPLRER